MGDHRSRSPSSPDLYNLLGISNICKGYKSFVAKKKSHKSIDGESIHNGSSKGSHNRHHKKQEEEEFEISYPTDVARGFNHQLSIDDSFFSRRSISRTTSSRRCKTPTPTSFSRCTSRFNTPTGTTPLFSRNMSQRNSSADQAEVFSSFLSRNNMSRRSTSVSEIPDLARDASRSQSRAKSRRPSESELPASPSPASPSQASPLSSSPNASRTCTTPRAETDNAGSSTSSLSRSMSRNTTPIVFSQSTARKKPAPPVEKKLAFTLEDLCNGCVKKIKITREVINNAGIIVQEEETLKINVQPGWRKGTKITFEGKGDEKPGYLPTDIIFLIDEKRHPLFKRAGRDDLEIAVEIPLVDALGGCSFPVPLLGGENMSVSFDDIIYHGYEKVIEGQGMPMLKDPTQRGNLRITCLVHFPKELSDEQRAEAISILQDCSYQ